MGADCTTVKKKHNQTSIAKRPILKAIDSDNDIEQSSGRKKSKKKKRRS